MTPPVIKNMIKKEDLRIGNWISDIHASEKGMWQVTSIRDSICHYGGFRAKYSDLSAIPITPEILIACGFEKNGFNQHEISISTWPDSLYKVLYFAGDYLYLQEGVMEQHRSTDALITIWNKDLMKQFYLHQLQNLYFALTQTELTIDLK